MDHEPLPEGAHDHPSAQSSGLPPYVSADEHGPAPEPLALEPPPPVPPSYAPTDGLWGDEPDPPPTTGSRRGMKTWVAAGAGAAVLVAGSVFGITAARSHTSASAASTTQSAPGAPGGPGQAGMGRGGGTFGTISSIDGSTLTIKAQSGSATTVKTTSSTAITQAATGSVSSVKVGDHLVVLGPRSGTKVAAERIVDQGSAAGATGAGSGTPLPGGPPAGSDGARGAGGPVSGTVTKVDGSTITLKSTGGTTYVVSTSSSTTVTTTETISISALKAGEPVMVTGSTSNGVVTATRIQTGSGGFGGFGGPGGGPGGSDGPGPNGQGGGS